MGNVDPCVLDLSSLKASFLVMVILEIVTDLYRVIRLTTALN